jgi:protein-tyrosine-phosphatase
VIRPVDQAARAAQASVMADPARLRILALVLTDPSGHPTAAQLAGPGGPVDLVREHLDAMATVGLLEPLGHGARARFHPTPDAIVRFGGAAIGSPPRRGPRIADPRDHGPALERISAVLTERFAATFGPETVVRFVRESYALLAERATVRQHLPALTARFASERLAALAAPIVDDGSARDVLFVCVHNSGRSQVAAAVLRSIAGDRVRVRTAGSEPAVRLDPSVRAELEHRGLARLTELPRPLTDEVVRASSVVVTMGCGDACPLVPGRHYEDWPVDDPAGAAPEQVARIVDDITARVNALVDQLEARR